MNETCRNHKEKYSYLPKIKSKIKLTCYTQVRYYTYYFFLKTLLPGTYVYIKYSLDIMYVQEDKLYHKK